jgi:hypothetical protein
VHVSRGSGARSSNNKPKLTAKEKAAKKRCCPVAGERRHAPELEQHALVGEARDLRPHPVGAREERLGEALLAPDVVVALERGEQTIEVGRPAVDAVLLASRGGDGGNER